MVNGLTGLDTPSMEEIAAAYPVKGLQSFMECPEHKCDVALTESGRIGSKCPMCLAEAVRALVKMRKGT